MEQRLGNIRLQGLVLVVGIGLMALKFIAWHITGSTAIMSDALESIVNVFAGALALYSLVLAAKPRDRDHPYGHGKVEFISAGVEGTLVLLAGGYIVVRAIMNFFTGHVVQDLAEGMLLAAAAGVVNLVLGLVLRSRGRHHHSMTMEASGTHLLSDAWSTAAMLVGLGVVKATGLMWVDSLFALGFGLFIAYQGQRVLRKAIAGIMDETDMGVAREIVELLAHERVPQWVDVHNLRIITYGDTLHIDCHVTLPWYYSLEQAHAEIKRMEAIVEDRMGRGVELFIHMDPCRPHSCRVCSMAPCPQRKATQERTVPWDLDSVLQDAQHQ